MLTKAEAREIVTKGLDADLIRSEGYRRGGSLPRGPRLNKSFGLYFRKGAGTCEQGERSDITGCTPASGSNGDNKVQASEMPEKPGAPGIEGPQESAGGQEGKEGSPPLSHENAKNIISKGISSAKQFMAKWGGKVSSCIDKAPVLGRCKKAMTSIMGKAKAFAEKRYGPKVAKMLMISGPAGGYGVMAGAQMLVGFPGVPIVNDVVSMVGQFAIAETIYQMGKGVGKVRSLFGKKKDLGDDMTDEQLAKAHKQLWGSMQKEFVKFLKQNEKELNASADKLKKIGGMSE